MRRIKLNFGEANYGSRIYETASRSRRAFSVIRPAAGTQDGKYIFTERNGIYIIDLQKTVKKLDEGNFVAMLLLTADPVCWHQAGSVHP